MWQPSKIGQTLTPTLANDAVVDVRSVILGVDTAAVATSMFRNQVAPLVARAPSVRQSSLFFCRPEASIATLTGNRSLAFGIAFPGRADSLILPRIYNLAAAVSVDADSGCIFVEPFIAQLPANATLEVESNVGSWNRLMNETNRHQYLPLDYLNEEGFCLSAGFKSQVLPEISSGSVMIFGVRLSFTTAVPNLGFSVSLHGYRWDSDIPAYDPGR